MQLDGGSILAASDSARSIVAYPAQADQSGHKVDGTPVTINPGLGPILRPGVPAMGIVPADWALRPSGVDAGDQFRLLFVTSTMRDATSSDIADYNSFVQNAAAAGHAAIRGYSAGFRALASTESVDARRQHRNHRDGGADLLAELLEPGRRQCGPLRRQLGQREPAHQRAGDGVQRRGCVVGIDQRRAGERSKRLQRRFDRTRCSRMQW